MHTSPHAYAGTSNLFASYLAGVSISWWDTEVPHISTASGAMPSLHVPTGVSAKAPKLSKDAPQQSYEADSGDEQQDTHPPVIDDIGSEKADTTPTSSDSAGPKATSESDTGASRCTGQSIYDESYSKQSSGSSNHYSSHPSALPFPSHNSSPDPSYGVASSTPSSWPLRK